MTKETAYEYATAIASIIFVILAVATQGQFAPYW